jgi:biotin synthase-related radical SAM superfamily protein
MKVLLSAGTYYHLFHGRSKFSETAYALQVGPCQGTCSFCSQSAFNQADKMYLSRIKWYPVELEEAAPKISREYKRFCLQTVIKSGFVEEAIQMLKMVETNGKSVTITPVHRKDLMEIKATGVDYIGVGLDSTEDCWDIARKPYPFARYMDFLREAIEVFGRRRVYAHLIYGICDNDRTFAELMEKLYEMGVEVALFAFTPVKGTPLEKRSRPDLRKYRRMQELRWLLAKGYRLDKIMNSDFGLEVRTGQSAHFTSGCPMCDRPFYNEDPLGDIYNIPFKGRANWS